MLLNGLMANKRCLIAAAGSGKTTYLVNEIWEHFQNAPVIFVTFTTTNQLTICEKIRKRFGFIPTRIKIMGWYQFLFRYFILPYKADVLQELNTIHVSLTFDSDYSRTYQTKSGSTFSKYKHNDIKGKFFTSGWRIHKDLVAEFAFLCTKGNEDSIVRRLYESADILCFDESQDFSGSDHEIIKLITRLYPGSVLFATDPRQHIYSTTKFGGKKYEGKIDLYLSEKVNTRTKKYVDIDSRSLSRSHRCIESICELASSLFQDLPSTETCTCLECMERRDKYVGLKGVFAVAEDDIELFTDKFKPMNLVFNRAEKSIVIGKCMTMGDSKGTESDVILLYPTDEQSKFLFNSRNTTLAEITRNKLYVGITRARYLLGIVFKKKHKFSNNLIPIWENSIS